jgi:hypothetical protein
MSTRIQARRIEIFEGEAALFVARVETAGGTPLTSSQVSAVSVSIFKMPHTTPAEAVYQLGSIDPATVYYDTLQHDDAENMLGDSGGYNAKYIVSADEFGFEGGHTYRVQIASQLGNSSHVMVFDVVVGEVY